MKPLAAGVSGGHELPRPRQPGYDGTAAPMRTGPAGIDHPAATCSTLTPLDYAEEAAVGKALDCGRFVAYARAQIQAAHDIHQSHHPSHLGLCNCGRPQPCTVVTACLATVAHYQAKLAIIGATVPLPTMEEATLSGLSPGRRYEVTTGMRRDPVVKFSRADLDGLGNRLLVGTKDGNGAMTRSAFEERAARSCPR